MNTYILTNAEGITVDLVYCEDVDAPEGYVLYDSAAIENAAKQWRNQELANTDWVVPVIDHPQHKAYLEYRQALRDWPTDLLGGFPLTRPELGV